VALQGAPGTLENKAGFFVLVLHQLQKDEHVAQQKQMDFCEKKQIHREQKLTTGKKPSNLWDLPAPQ
jgi:hypothetical protein